jgi:hypothetical protein
MASTMPSLFDPLQDFQESQWDVTMQAYYLTLTIPRKQQLTDCEDSSHSVDSTFHVAEDECTA